MRLGHEQHEPQQLLLRARDAAQDVVDGQGVRGADDRGGAEPLPPVARVGVAQLAAVHRLEQRPLLHAAHLVDALEVGVAEDRVGQVADDRQDRVDEPRLAARRAQVVGARMDVDQVVDDRPRGAHDLAPLVGVVAHDLVRVLAHGQAGRRARRPARRRSRPGRSWRMTSSSAVAPKVPAFSPGRVDVVRERDPLRVAGDSATCCGVSAVPRLATTFSKPDWWAISASV